MNYSQAKELEQLKENNLLLDKILEKNNEIEKEKQEMNLFLQEMAQKQRETELRQKNEIKNIKRRHIENLAQKNSNIKLEILENENEHKLDLKRLENRYNTELLEQQRIHKNDMDKLDLERIENNYKKENQLNEIKQINLTRKHKNDLQRQINKNEHVIKMKDEELNHKAIMDNLENNADIMKKESEEAIFLNNNETELEKIKIKNELEIANNNIKNELEEKLQEQNFQKNEALFRQNCEKMKMDAKFELMMGQLLLDKIESCKQGKFSEKKLINY